ncbi:carboxylesterase [Chitinibacter bivalviorum]|uniref:Carboxylesterase n=1 Tax=Chitinibacter bivalviorum TaxID=2739434 RepID=A0A7H9BGV6_9NEIS|nr:carboxylesterase [Chitinibacter bivalviorum]QLG87953.1 carboxylesterase [Chitinibacter bivalviorum]
MSSNLLPCVEIETGSNPTAAVIWLHGLGADGNDFAPIVPELGLPENLAIRFIFPHAPTMPITCNNGYVMRAWYDIVHFDQISRQADVAGVKASIEYVRDLIADQNAKGIPTDRIILAGFSQGGAIAYTAGLTHPAPLAGIVCLSTYLPAEELLTSDSIATNKATPLLAAHGSHDPVVGISLGEKAKNYVANLGVNVSWQTYPIQHSVCLPEIQLIGQFIRQQLG